MYFNISNRPTVFKPLIGAVVLIAIFTCNEIFSKGPSYYNSPNAGKSRRQVTDEENKFSSEEKLYFDTGIGDKDKLYPRLVQHLKSRIWVPRKFKPANEWGKNDFLRFGKSQELERFLGTKRNGFFIECGANDGLAGSNTAFLELTKNWTGLLIEGDPRVYPSLLDSGRRAYMLPHCVSPVDKPFRANFRIAGGFQGLSDFFRLHDPPNPKTLKETLVTCYPFNAVMEALGVYHIDFFSLDVEGAELDVLQTIDFNKFRIDLLRIEYAYTPLEQKQKESSERLEKYRALFNATGLYEEIGIINFNDTTNLGLDVVFRRINNTLSS